MTIDGMWAGIESGEKFTACTLWKEFLIICCREKLMEAGMKKKSSSAVQIL